MTGTLSMSFRPCWYFSAATPTRNSINHPLVLEKFKVAAKDRKYQFWERNPLSIQLFNKEVLEQKLNYIHNNPYHEKWNILNELGKYNYSSEEYYKNETNDFGFLSHDSELF